MPALRKRSQSVEHTNAEDDDLATFERMITVLKTKSEEKRRQVRMEIMAAYAHSVDAIEDSMHAQFKKVKESLCAEHVRRTTRVRELVVQRDGLVREIDALVCQINTQVGQVDEYMSTVREEIRRAGGRGQEER